MDRGHLFSNAGITCLARVCDAPVGDPHAYSGFSKAVGSTSQDRTLDDAHLAYVSVTGVLVYLMLYRWFPPPGLSLAR